MFRPVNHGKAIAGKSIKVINAVCNFRSNRTSDPFLCRKGAQDAKPVSFQGRIGDRGSKNQQHMVLVKYILVLSSLILSFADVPATYAHKVKVAADVGATLHLEPNDMPRAGENTQTWFALTRKGGQSIPLAQCDCQLAVFAEPHTPGEPALLEPALKPVNAERYQGVPGAEINFPKPGIYQLHLAGKPKSGAVFQPFQLNFEVTVAASVGSANNQVESQQTIKDLGWQNQGSSLPVWAIALTTVVGLGIIFVAWQLPKGKG